MAIEHDSGPEEGGTDGCLTEATTTKRFLLAGNARATLVSEKTGARFTYRVRAKDTDDGGKLFFVGLLTGPDNNASYSFLGTIFPDGSFRHGKKSPVPPGAPSAKAFAWAWSWIAAGKMPPGCEIHHEGRCGACGRALTVPESILTGLGPVCMAKGAKGGA